MKLYADSKAPKQLRNEQCGDWQYGEDFITASSREMSDWRYEFLVQLHELVEAALCKSDGITDEQVTAFDALFETERANGQHSETDEDGDDERAPYRRQHRMATIVEMIVADALEVDWKKYSDEIYAD